MTLNRWYRLHGRWTTAPRSCRRWLTRLSCLTLASAASVTPSMCDDAPLGGGRASLGRSCLAQSTEARLKLPMTFTIVPEDELEGVELPRRLWVSINRQGGVKLRMPAAGTTFPVAYTFL